MTYVRKNRLFIVILKFLITIFLEFIMLLLTSLLVNFISFPNSDFFSINLNTGESKFETILNLVLWVFFIRLYFTEFLIKLIAEVFSKTELTLLIITSVQISIFSISVEYLYHNELNFDYFLHPIQGWWIHLPIAVVVVSLIRFMVLKNKKIGI
jgi:hypothetical protein